MTENIVTGKKYRILTDATQDIWDRISFWTKASDVYYDDNSSAEDNRPIGILKRGTAYVVGTVAYEITAPSWVMLKCTTAGTTAASTPSTYKTISASGTVITDGTAKFTVYDIRPTTTLSTNAYSVPTVSLLNSEISNFAHYSTSEYFTGKYWINGKKIFGKVIDFGALPNSNIKSVNHNISGLSFVTLLSAIVYPSSGTQSWQMLNFASSVGVEQTMRIFCNTTQVTIGTGTDRTNLKAHVFMEYTK